METYSYVADFYNKDIEDILNKLKLDPQRKIHMEKLADAFFDHLIMDNIEFGGWGLDSKRPFGNSHVYNDLAEIVGLKYNYDDEEIKDYLLSLYEDLGVYLRYRWLNK